MYVSPVFVCLWVIWSSTTSSWNFGKGHLDISYIEYDIHLQRTDLPNVMYSKKIAIWNNTYSESHGHFLIPFDFTKQVNSCCYKQFPSGLCPGLINSYMLTSFNMAPKHSADNLVKCNYYNFALLPHITSFVWPFRYRLDTHYYVNTLMSFKLVLIVITTSLSGINKLLNRSTRNLINDCS